MAVSKEIANDVKRFEELSSEVNNLYDKLQALFSGDDHLGDTVLIGGFSISDNPADIADATKDGEYNRIITRYEDSVEGCYYIPIENTGKFVAIYYST